jgi:hypothetical protein
MCGMRVDHPLRKRLDKFLATSGPISGSADASGGGP